MISLKVTIPPLTKNPLYMLSPEIDILLPLNVTLSVVAPNDGVLLIGSNIGLSIATFVVRLVELKVIFPVRLIVLSVDVPVMRLAR